MTDEDRSEETALRQQAALILRELADVLHRQKHVLRDTAEAAAAIAAIRRSTSWRLLESYRWLRMRALGQQHRIARSVDRWRLRRGSVRSALRRASLGVNVCGYITAESGMGEATRASIRTLELAGIPLALENLPSPQRAQDVTYTRFAQSLPHPINLIHLNAENMEAFARQKGRTFFRNRHTIGFWFWELSTFPREWTPAFHVVDEVWVASRFTQAALRDATVPVMHMTPGLAFPVPPTLGRSHFGIAPDGFVFLFVFDVSSEIERKNPLAVIRAFRHAQFRHEQAILVLKFTNAAFNRAATRRLYQEAVGLNVLMLDGFMNRQELGALINIADAYVSLHRAEGFGMTMAEAMAFGKPVVATGYSGNMDFMTDRNSFLVRHVLTTLNRNYGSYPRGAEWADADVEHAAHFMRSLVDNPAAARNIGLRAAADVRAQFDPHRAAEQMKARLRQIIPDDVAAFST